MRLERAHLQGMDVRDGVAHIDTLPFTDELPIDTGALPFTDEQPIETFNQEQTVSNTTGRRLLGCTSDVYSNCPGWANSGNYDPQWSVSGRSIGTDLCQTSCGRCVTTTTTCPAVSGYVVRTNVDHNSQDINCFNGAGTAAQMAASLSAKCNADSRCKAFNIYGTANNGCIKTDATINRNRENSVQCFYTRDATTGSTTGGSTTGGSDVLSMHNMYRARHRVPNLQWDTNVQFTSRPWTDNSAYFENIGHFTALVWKSTTFVGFDSASGCGRTYYACNYSPAGNVAADSYFLANVLPK
eukprot:gene13894-19820_t